MLQMELNFGETFDRAQELRQHILIIKTTLSKHMSSTLRSELEKTLNDYTVELQKHLRTNGALKCDCWEH